MSDIIITDGKSPVVAAAETTGAPETPVTPDTQNQAAADTGNENEDTVTATKRGRSLSVGGKIGIVVAFCLFALVGVAGVGISQMQKINTKIVGIAERDIPLTEMVTKITVHQLEQALNLERSIRFGEEMKSHPSVRTHFEESVHRFEKLSAKVNSEIRKGEEMAQHDIDTAATEAEKAEFTYVLSALKKIEHEHASFDEHSLEAIKLLKAGNVDAALKLAGGIEKEVEKLDHELVALLDHISKFTLHAAQEAEKLKKFAVKLMMIVSIAGFLIAALCAWLTVTRTVARPLRSVVGVLGELDAGNLDVEIAVRSNDEIGAVAAALGKFRENMRETQRLEAEATEKEKKLAESDRKAETERLESEKKAEAAKRGGRGKGSRETPPGAY
jgi:methyl-accepting chemotaxis protein